MPARAGPSEAQIQAAIVVAIRRCCPAVYVAAIPNGGSRHRIEAARLKGQGVSRGVPDLLLIGHPFRVGFIEVKKAGGRLTPEQAAFRHLCGNIDIPWSLARSVEDALDALAGWGATVKGRVQ